MRVVLFGATGMVGKGVLYECLDAPDVEEVLAVGRSPTGMSHPKLVEVAHTDFSDFSRLEKQLRGADACFFCLGVSSAGMREAEYTRLTYDIAVAAARSMHRANPTSVFVYVSGAGTDSTEAGRVMWARVKGRTENRILGMGFAAAYAFRPAFIQPERGITSRTGWYRAAYVLLKPFATLMLRSQSATTTSRVGLAMIELAATRPPQRIVEPPDINRLAAARASRMAHGLR